MLDCTCVNFENIFEKHNPDVATVAACYIVKATQAWHNIHSSFDEALHRSLH